MKKTILLLITIFIAGNSYAQKIISDQIKNNVRYILTDEAICRNSFTSKFVPCISLNFIGEVNSNTSNEYILEIITHGPGQRDLQKGITLLLKNVDGEVIKLQTTSESKVTDKYDTTLHMKVYTRRSLFEVSEEQIQKIAKGIIKIRMENGEVNEFLESDYKKDKIGVAVSSRYELIKERLNEDEKDIEDGF